MKRRSGNKFVILVLLTKSPGRFISKDELLTAIGGHEFGPHHSIVDTCITYLDRLLQEADGSPTIEKAPGVGFRLRL
ncbi:MAG: helix-turn-helix domain-containing protein [Acidimicrobiales bacterium]|jgi:DNA-binding response OmpR family regulator